MYRLNFIAKRFITISIQRSTIPLTIADMPHPKSLPIIGTKLDLISGGSGKKLHEFVDNRHKQLGPIYAERLVGSTELVFISDPELIKSLFIKLEGKYPIHLLPEPWTVYEKIYGSHRGLFFMNGEEWLLNRRIVNKHLLSESSDDWIRPPIRETVEEFIKKIRIQVSNNGYLFKDMETELYNLSTNVIISILLGTHSLSRSPEYEKLLKLFTASVRKIFETTTRLYAWPVEWCQRYELKAWRDFQESVELSLNLAKKMTNEMIRHCNRSNGLVNRLVQDGRKEEIINRIIADFIIAAGDTTAFTTLWILWLLSKNDEVVQNIRSKDDSYVKCIVKEAMRMYPVAPFLTRILTQDTILGKYKLSKGTPIIASIYTTGRSEENFSKPNLFLPYRWDRNDQQTANLINHTPSASLPFAMGARSCIGKKMAMIQLTEVVSQIVKNFNIKCMNKHKINCITSQVLVPDEPIELFFSMMED